MYSRTVQARIFFGKAAHTPPVMPPPMMDQKEDYWCAVLVIETVRGNKCVETKKVSMKVIRTRVEASIPPH